MESSILQESPLSHYLEGQGEASENWPLTEHGSVPESPDRPSFAPKGPPKPAQSRVEKLLSPLRVTGRRRRRTLTALQDICTAANNAQVSASENDLFLDQLRYPIITSHCLAQEILSPVETSYPSPSRDKGTTMYHPDNSFSPQGAAVSTMMSFPMAWTLHWARATSPRSSTYSLNACVILVLWALVAIIIYGYGRRKALQRIHHTALGAVNNLITHCHALDKVARSAVGLIQEVEIVSRGYEINNPLPPVSRLELKAADRRCPTLRSGVANTISSTIRRYLEAHTAMLPFVDPVDMQRYHDIYDLSIQDYQEMIRGLPSTSEEDPESLRGLRTSLTQLFVARQILLCDLLALPSKSSIPDSRRWSAIADEIASLSDVVEISAISIEGLINEEESRRWGDRSRSSARESAERDECHASETLVPSSPGKERAQAQLRRLDALSHSIRSLNARMLVLRDEANHLTDVAEESSEISSVLAEQYDLVGGDLRSLMSEWEHGRKTMLLNAGGFDQSRLSRSSSSLRSPHSPAHSLGGKTVVSEGGPAEALRRLTGECAKPPNSDGLGSDEEVFEAVSIPFKLNCLSMTREEKMAKMREDRQKRATLQENRDATTSMLRELETVIKHRPRGRTTSRTTSA